MAKRRNFGATWWGEAWIDALEHRSSLDPNRLPRGRTYARHDRVSGMTLAPGEVTALVAGSRATPYRVRMGIRTFTDAEWDAVLDAITARAGHAAALLDGELDPGIVEDARSAGVDLLPMAGELTPRCSCPDWANPCKHAAAVCYLTADLLDEDPFTLLLLRGWAREDVLAEVRRRRSGSTAAQGATGDDPAVPTTDPGVVARDAWQWHPTVPPRPPAPRPAPGKPAPWAADPPADAPFSAAGLRELAADAAERAWAMARGDGDSGLQTKMAPDLARRAAQASGTDRWAHLARPDGPGPDARALAQVARVWRYGGAEALAVVAEPPWRPDPLVMAAARDAVGAALRRYGAVAVDRNRLTIPAIDVQLRLGRDGRWWRFEKNSGRWELAAAPARQADDLILSPL